MHPPLKYLLLSSLVATQAFAAPNHRKIAVASGGAAAAAKENAARVNALSDQVKNLTSEVESLKARVQAAPAEKAAFHFTNMTYFKMGFSLLAPRARTFAFNTDTGLGLFLGFGQYFGEHHVVDLSLDWDLYPSMTLKYRYEFHYPSVTFSPVIGYKIRAANMRSLDDFLSQPDDVKNSFLVIGGMAAFPITQNVLAIEMLYYINQQVIFAGNVALHMVL